MRVAHTVALRSLCDRDKVGAVIVDSNNRIVSTGYNGPPWGFFSDPEYDGFPCEDPRDRPAPSPCVNWCERGRGMIDRVTDPVTGITLMSDYGDCPSLHAEANALIVCDRSVREFGTIYVSSSICSTCAKLIANSGLSRVVIDASSEERVLYRDPFRWMEFMRDCGLEVIVVPPRT